MVDTYHFELVSDRDCRGWEVAVWRRAHPSNKKEWSNCWNYLFVQAISTSRLKPTPEGLPRHQNLSLLPCLFQALLSLGLPHGEAPDQPGDWLFRHLFGAFLLQAYSWYYYSWLTSFSPFWRRWVWGCFHQYLQPLACLWLQHQALALAWSTQLIWILLKSQKRMK